jgi:hypothetical protein
MGNRPTLRFSLEALAILAVAAALYRMKPGTLWILGGMALAWVVVSSFEIGFSHLRREPLAADGDAGAGVTEMSMQEPPADAGAPAPPSPEPAEEVEEPEPVVEAAADPEVEQVEPAEPTGRRRFWQRAPREEPLPLPPEQDEVHHVRVLQREDEAEPVPTPAAVEAEEPQESAAQAALPGATPQPIPDTLLVDEPEVRPLAEPVEPELEPEPAPAPEPEPASPVLAAVPEPEPEPEPEPPAAAPPQPVVLASRGGPREWNLWELERLARDRAGTDTIREEEWSYLFVYLREFADSNGMLPVDFDGLVRESFPELVGTG